MDRLEVSCNDFARDLSRIQHLVELVISVRALGATNQENIPDQDSWPESLDLWRKAKEHRTDLPLVAGSLLMYLAGRFEYYARQLVEITADEISVSVDGFEKLPASLQKNLKNKVMEVYRNPGRYGMDEVQAEGYLKDYVDLLQGSFDRSKVPSALISLTDANMKGRVLAEIAKSVGVENLWKDIGKQASIKLALETATDSEATAEAQSKLDALMDERNGLAHPAGEMTFPDPDRVLDTVDFLRALSEALRDLFRVHLVQWRSDNAI